MPEDIPVPQRNPPVHVSDSSRPIIITPELSKQIEIDEPPPSEPAFPIGEPGMQRQPQIVSVNANEQICTQLAVGRNDGFLPLIFILLHGQVTGAVHFA